MKLRKGAGLGRKAALILVLLGACPSLVSAHGPQQASVLGSYEKEAVARVLTARGLTIEAAPEGKRVGTISIVNLNVFSNKTGWLRNLNRLHRATRVDTMRSELLVRSGERWERERIEESERILRNPETSSFVVIVPIQSTSQGVVDLLVVTRDIWSLRLNSEFVNEGGRFTSLQLSAAESNLFGRRKHVSLTFDMTQGDYAISARWRDRNLFGKRWRASVEPGLIWSRGKNDLEGGLGRTKLEYPLWSLASRWGAAFEFSYRDAISRNFLGDNIALYDVPETVEIEEIPESFRLRNIEVRSQLRRSLGTRYKHNLSIGHLLLSTRPELINEFPGQDGAAVAFARDLFPRSERSSAFTVEYEFFQARFVTYRNIDGFDLPEILVVGPSLLLELDLALSLIGSERNFLRQRVRAGYRFNLHKDAYADFEISVAQRSERLADDTLLSKDREYRGQWFAATPAFAGALRLVAFGEISLKTRVEENLLVRLGGQGDLRGYPVGSFVGTSSAKQTLEFRTLPHRLGFARVGYVAFWDAGHAADRPRDIRLRHDIGLGLKALVPQIGEGLFFLYWAMPLDREFDQIPGRISLGFEHALE